MASSIHRIRIHANPDAVFAAIATGEGMKAWFTPNIEGSFNTGETLTFRFSNGETFEWKTTGLLTKKELERECIAGRVSQRVQRLNTRLSRTSPAKPFLSWNTPAGRKVMLL